MPSSSPERRPPLAVAMEWVSKVTTISLTMALPALAGHWADGRWGLSPWLTILGAVLGFAAGMSQLLQLTRKSGSSQSSRGSSS